MESLDPRIQRWGLDENSSELKKAELDQFETYEVFVQTKEGMPLNHAGIVHAPDSEVAFVLAKEQFSRRKSCSGLAVVPTTEVHTSEYTDGETSAYSTISDEASSKGDKDFYQVFHLVKRGKQHVHVGNVLAHNPNEAFAKAKKEFNEGIIYNVWVIPTNAFRFSGEDEKIIWSTLPEKKFREATDYKASDKIKSFKEGRQ